MNTVVKISYVLVVFAAFAYLFLPLYAPYAMAVGAAGIAVSHLREVYAGRNLRLRRIYRQRRIVALFFLVASFLMFRPGMLWAVLLLIAALLELYTLWVIVREARREEAKRH